MKTVDISESVAACDLKVGSYRQQIYNKRRYVSIQGQGHFWTVAKGHLYMILKTAFLRAIFNQISYESFQIHGDEILFI